MLTDEKLKELRNAKCQFPKCENQPSHVMKVGMPVIQTMESGEIEVNKSIEIQVPMCELHSFITMQGVIALTQIIEGYIASGKMQKYIDEQAKIKK